MTELFKKDPRIPTFPSPDRSLTTRGSCQPTRLEIVPFRPFSLKAAKQQGPRQCVSMGTTRKATGVTTAPGSGVSDSNVRASPEHLLHESFLLTQNPRQNPKQVSRSLPLGLQRTYTTVFPAIFLSDARSVFCFLTGPDTGSHLVHIFFQMGLRLDVVTKK